MAAGSVLYSRIEAWEDPTSLENKTRVITDWPADRTTIPVFYTNHIEVRPGPEEIYLDLCQVDPTVVDRPEDGPVIRAPVRARVILTRTHAARLATVLGGVLSALAKGDGEVKP